MSQDTSTTTVSSDDTPKPETAGKLPVIPGYEIVRELSRGGQGVVYQAVQTSTKRKVALKVLLDGGMASALAQRRFLREIELAASLRHASIVTVFDSGVTEKGQQFYVMDYIRGQTITATAREGKLPVRRTLELFGAMCEAVGYAHQRGVIHRDLKPSNILVDAEGVPRVLDFGLAKTMADRADSLASQTGQLLGTLRYMSPEQTRGNPDEIDMRTDVYSLGVILYELLTGRFPYPAEGALADVLGHICSTEPTALARSWTAESGVGAGEGKSGKCPINDELATIVKKCLSKDREKRYQNAGELARDLGHYLRGEPIEAKRDSASYVLRKALSRHRGPAIAGVVILVVAAMGLAGSAVAWRRAAVDRDAAIAASADARANFARADEQEKLSRLAVARSYARQHAFALARETLKSVEATEGVAQDWRWAAWEFLRRSGEISVVDLNANLGPAERLQPSRENQGYVRIDVAGQKIWSYAGAHPRCFDLGTGQSISISPETHVEVPFNWYSRDVLHLEGTKGGRHVVVDAKGWPDRTESTIAMLKADGSVAWKENLPAPGVANAGSLSDDGRLLALAMENDTVQIRRIEDTGSELLRTIDGIQDDVAAMAFDSSGERLHVITSGWLHRVYAVKTDADVEVTALAHGSTVRRLAFDATGRYLASGGYDGQVKVWDVRTHECVANILAMVKTDDRLNGITETRFLLDGRIFSRDAYGVGKIWDWHSGAVVACYTKEGGQNGMTVSDDGRTLYVGGSADISRWDTEMGTQEGAGFGRDNVLSGESNYRLILLADKNRLIVLRSQDYRDTPNVDLIRCQIWDLNGPTLERELRHQTDGLRDADVSADENMLAIASRDGTGTLWDWQNGKLLYVLNASPGHSDTNIISAIRFDPTEPVVATAGQDNRVLFWSTTTGRQLAELNVDERHEHGFGPTGLLKDIAFSPDGKMLAVTVGNDIWWVDMGFFDQQIKDLRRR